MRPIQAGGSFASFFAIALLTGLLAVAWFAGQRGLAYVLAQEPGYEIERWRSGEWVADKIRLDAMQAALNEARNLDPRNPELMDELALFLAARVKGRYTRNPEVHEAHQQSLAWLRQSLEQRPTSGDTWINLALMKFRLDEIDLEFSQALQQAMRRGPWEPILQLRVIELGLGNWKDLPEPLHDALKKAIRDQARWRLVKQKPALQSLLGRYGRADLAYLLE